MALSQAPGPLAGQNAQRTVTDTPTETGSLADIVLGSGVMWGRQSDAVHSNTKSHSSLN